MSKFNSPPPIILVPQSPGALAPPDWNTLREEISCPLCGYNLRGLSDPQCPECGYSFNWSQLLDPANRKHPYLFEHHPEMNIRSFLRTASGGLRPKRFWTSLTPVQTFVPSRLVIYWLIAIAIGGAALLASSSYGLFSGTIGFTNKPAIQPPIFGNYVSYVGSFPSRYVRLGFADFLYEWRRSGALVQVVLLVMWPWVTFLALMIFQISMRRAGIRKMHVLRTVLYSGDFLLWPGLLTVFTTGVFLAAQAAFKSGAHDLPDWVFVWGFLACWIVMAHRLQVAYRRYLRFDHPLATVIAAQIVAAMTVTAIVFQLSF